MIGGDRHISTTVTAIHGIRVVDGRQVHEVKPGGLGLTWNTPFETGGFLRSRSVRLEIEAQLIKK